MNSGLRLRLSGGQQGSCFGLRLSGPFIRQAPALPGTNFIHFKRKFTYSFFVVSQSKKNLLPSLFLRSIREYLLLSRISDTFTISSQGTDPSLVRIKSFSTFLLFGFFWK